MEAVCDDIQRIWHVIFGAPGANNDVNILHQSGLFNQIRVGKWPPVRPTIDIAGKLVDWYYYLADGVYPRYLIFLQSVVDAKTKKEKLFGAHQEGARKAVEGVFVVLFSRFHILCKPSRL